MSLRIVALDDYQGLVEQMGLAGRLAGELQGAGLDGELADFELVSVRGHLAGAALAEALAGAAVVVAMRERTRFDRVLLSALPDLRLLVTTGLGNAAIDLAAADEQVVTADHRPAGAAPRAERGLDRRGRAGRVRRRAAAR